MTDNFSNKRIQEHLNSLALPYLLNLKRDWSFLLDRMDDTSKSYTIDRLEKLLIAYIAYEFYQNLKKANVLFDNAFKPNPYFPLTEEILQIVYNQQ